MKSSKYRLVANKNGLVPASGAFESDDDVEETHDPRTSRTTSAYEHAQKYSDPFTSTIRKVSEDHTGSSAPAANAGNHKASKETSKSTSSSGPRHACVESVPDSPDQKSSATGKQRAPWMDQNKDKKPHWTEKLTVAERGELWDALIAGVPKDVLRRKYGCEETDDEKADLQEEKANSGAPKPSTTVAVSPKKEPATTCSHTDHAGCVHVVYVSPPPCYHHTGCSDKTTNQSASAPAPAAKNDNSPDSNTTLKSSSSGSKRVAFAQPEVSSRHYAHADYDRSAVAENHELSPQFGRRVSFVDESSDEESGSRFRPPRAPTPGPGFNRPSSPQDQGFSSGPDMPSPPPEYKSPPIRTFSPEEIKRIWEHGPRLQRPNNYHGQEYNRENNGSSSREGMSAEQMAYERNREAFETNQHTSAQHEERFRFDQGNARPGRPDEYHSRPGSGDRRYQNDENVDPNMRNRTHHDNTRSGPGLSHRQNQNDENVDPNMRRNQYNNSSTGGPSHSRNENQNQSRSNDKSTSQPRPHTHRKDPPMTDRQRAISEEIKREREQAARNQSRDQNQDSEFTARERFWYDNPEHARRMRESTARLKRAAAESARKVSPTSAFAVPCDDDDSPPHVSSFGGSPNVPSPASGNSTDSGAGGSSKSSPWEHPSGPMCGEFCPETHVSREIYEVDSEEERRIEAEGM